MRIPKSALKKKRVGIDHTKYQGILKSLHITHGPVKQLSNFGDRPWIYIVILILHRFYIYKFAYLLKFVCKPQIDTRSACAVIYQHAQNRETFESPDERKHVPSYPRRCSVFSLQLSHSTCVIFMVCSEPRFLHFCALWWRFHCLKWHRHTGLKCSQAQGGCDALDGENICAR